MFTSSAIRYFLYVRKSDESEDRQVQSIDDQKAVLLRFANALGLTIVAVFEEAHSAKIANTRAIFNDMVRRIEKGEADGILCWQINRLFRNLGDYSTIGTLLLKGVIQSVRTPDRDYVPTDNVLLLAIEAGIATQYSIDLSKNVKRGFDEKAYRGTWPLGPKPGYSSVPKVVGNKTLHVIDKDPERFALLREAWDMALTGAYTAPQILRRLDRSGFRLRATKKWPSRKMSRSMLYRLFHDPFYYGYFLYKGVLTQGDHPPMVSKSEFDRVQNILKNSDTQPQKHEFAFSGLIRCGVCGCLVTPERKIKHFKTTGRTKEYVYYHCSGFKGCRKDSIPEDGVQIEIGILLGEFKLDRQFLDLAEPVLKRFYGEEVDQNDHGDTTLRRKYAAAKDRVNRLFEMREAGEITATEFAERKVAYQNEASKYDQEITEGMTRIRENAKLVHQAVTYLVEAPTVFLNASVSSKREMARFLAKEYILTKDKQLTIVPDPLLEQILTFEPAKEANYQVENDEEGPKSPKKPPRGGGAKKATFEPLKTTKYMVRGRELALTSPIQRAWQDHIRNLITGEKVSFGETTKSSPR